MQKIGEDEKCPTCDRNYSSATQVDTDLKENHGMTDFTKQCKI